MFRPIQNANKVSGAMGVEQSGAGVKKEVVVQTEVLHMMSMFSSLRRAQSSFQ
jgi:hypothetical protein